MPAMIPAITDSILLCKLRFPHCQPEVVSLLVSLLVGILQAEP